MHALPDIDIGRHAQSDRICLPNALHSSMGQTITHLYIRPKMFFSKDELWRLIVTCFTKKGWSGTRIVKEYLNKIAQNVPSIPKHVSMERYLTVT